MLALFFALEMNDFFCYDKSGTFVFEIHATMWATSDAMGKKLAINGLVVFVYKGQDDINIRNSLVICYFLMFGLDRLAPILTKATVIDFTPEKLMFIGERIHNLAQL